MSWPRTVGPWSVVCGLRQFGAQEATEGASRLALLRAVLLGVSGGKAILLCAADVEVR